jgi:conjugative transfer region lipoprotein (TIGR03751 family)
MIPPGGSMTMTQIYQQETGAGTVAQGRASALAQVRAQLGYRSALSVVQPRTPAHYTLQPAVEHLFQQLANPQIPMYIYPHLVRMNGEAYPKPGMTTAFFLYRHNHFALPSELY